MTRPIITGVNICGVTYAYREGYDAEKDKQGHGMTEAEAIADLEWLEQEAGE